MAITTIIGQRVRVVPIDVGREYVGPADAAVHDHLNVPLTSESLRAIGGNPLQVGETWACYLDLLYLSTANVLTAQAITAVDPLDSRLIVYDPHAGDDLCKRKSGQAIAGTSPVLYQLLAIGAGSPGRFKVVWHSTEAVTEYPTAGVWPWDLWLNYNHEYIHAAAGWIEVMPAKVT